MLVMTWALQMNAVGVASLNNQCPRHMMIPWGKVSWRRPFKTDIGQHEMTVDRANEDSAHLVPNNRYAQPERWATLVMYLKRGYQPHGVLGANTNQSKSKGSASHLIFQHHATSPTHETSGTDHGFLKEFKGPCSNCFSRLIQFPPASLAIKQKRPELFLRRAGRNECCRR